VTAIQNTENVQLEYEFVQPNFGTTNRFKPVNVGFGISYVLPVVVALLSAKPGDLLIIENPESHIHPRGQAELGKLVALAAKNGVQIVVETHSDHFVNGIRVAVKEGTIDRSEAILFYFEKTVAENEQFSKITDIEIDQNGELSEYPENMMDEWSNQLFKLL
jgi:predicted ATPase